MNEERPEEPRVAGVILGLGSNEGDRVRHIERALGELTRYIRLERVSDIYETEPREVRDQPWFLNLVCTGMTRLRPWDLLEFVLDVENREGRVRGERYGPRTIDIDILAYDDTVMEEQELTLPHPRMAERAFVLQPLADIAPEWRHPATGLTAQEMLDALEDQVIRPYSSPPSPSAPIL